MGLQWEKKIIQKYQGEIRFEDLTGRKNWINYFRFTFDPEEKGLLFIGEPHLGKKTLIRAAAGKCMAEGFEAYEVYGEDLVGDREELKEQIEMIYDKIVSGRKVLLLYSMDQIKNKAARTMLAFGLEQILKDAENAVILATAQRAEKLPERLLKFFTICPVRTFRENELTEVMEAFLGPCCPMEKEKQEKIKEFLKDRNCWELESIANFAVNEAVLELTDGQGKTLDEVQELLGEGNVQLTPEQIQKAAEDIESISWKKEAKEYIYADPFIGKPEGQEISEIQQKPHEEDSVPDEAVTGIAKLGDTEIQSSMEVVEQILQEGDPTLEEMDQMLAAKGELEELIDLSEMEVVD